MTTPRLPVPQPTPVLCHTSWQDNHEGQFGRRSSPLNPRGVPELMMTPGHWVLDFFHPQLTFGKEKDLTCSHLLKWKPFFLDYNLNSMVNHNHSLVPLIWLYCLGKTTTKVDSNSPFTPCWFKGKSTSVLTCGTFNLCPQFSRRPSAAARPSFSALLVHSLPHYPGWQLYIVTSFSRSLMLPPTPKMELCFSLYDKVEVIRREDLWTLLPHLPACLHLPSYPLFPWL